LNSWFKLVQIRIFCRIILIQSLKEINVTNLGCLWKFIFANIKHKYIFNKKLIQNFIISYNNKPDWRYKLFVFSLRFNKLLNWSPCIEKISLFIFKIIRSLWPIFWCNIITSIILKTHFFRLITIIFRKSLLVDLFNITYKFIINHSSEAFINIFACNCFWNNFFLKDFNNFLFESIV